MISWQILKLKQYERSWRPSVLCHKLLICSDLHVLTQHNNSRHQNNYEWMSMWIFDLQLHFQSENI